MRLAAAALLALGGAALAATDAPVPFVDEKAGFRLAVPAGFAQVPTDASQAGAPLALWANDATNQVAVVARIEGPTDGAYADDAKFYDAVEAGIKAKSAKYKRISVRHQKLGKKAKVPALDLWFRQERDGKPVTVGGRWLFFRGGYALSLMVDVPGGAGEKAAHKLIESFSPNEN